LIGKTTTIQLKSPQFKTALHLGAIAIERENENETKMKRA